MGWSVPAVEIVAAAAVAAEVIVLVVVATVVSVATVAEVEEMVAAAAWVGTDWLTVAADFLAGGLLEVDAGLFLLGGVFDQRVALYSCSRPVH